MIHRLELHNFKAFERFSVRFPGDTYLAGPNNAGKSTIISALRACAYMLRIAQRRRPTDVTDDGRNQVVGYFFDSAQVALSDENLPHEFREVESRLVLHFTGNRRLTAFWPADPDEDPFFYLQSGGHAVQTAREAADDFPRMGIIPILSPIDQREVVLTPKYVRENVDGRLASRHFRNQLWLLREEEDEGENLEAFLTFAEPWLSEIQCRDLDTHRGEKEMELDLYYREPGRRSDKEIVWAGDGIQIWLQILLHVFRLRDSDVLILDEPDVFLHPDLQRRLVRLLESLKTQSVAATHSAEVLTEAPSEAVVWVDKSRRNSIGAPDAALLSELVGSLGTQFNIRLAKTLRAKTVLFVEGQDMKFIRQIAATLGAERLARELDITVVPLEGFDNWDRVEPFKWLVDDLLKETLKIFVVVDRDYRPESAARTLKARLHAIGVTATVWNRKELESYFLVQTVIARLTGLEVAKVDEMLGEIVSTLETAVFALFTTERQRVAPRDRQVQALRAAKEEFDALWRNTDVRLQMCPPKEVLSCLNRRLQEAGLKAVSFGAIVREMRADEVPTDLARLVERVEDSLLNR